MSSISTMQLIAETFVTLSEEHSPEKVSVSDIVAASGKNRKTFYYHFLDKNHLVAWVFRHDLGILLKEKFPDDQLVYEQTDPKKDPLAMYPYYLFNKKGVRSLNHADFFITMAECLQARRAYYAKVLRDNSPSGLQSYLRNLYTPALKHDIRFILSNRYLKEESVSFLAEFYTSAFLSCLVNRTTDPQRRDITEGVGPFANIVHSSLENEIKEQQLRRML